MNFFDTPNPQEEALADAMQRQWDADNDKVRKRGIVPDWIGEPRPLSKDRVALLNILYEIGYVEWPKAPSRQKSEVARQMGYKDIYTGKFDMFGNEIVRLAVDNAKAVIDSMVREGLIEWREYRGGNVLQMTNEGEYALEDWQIEQELGFV